jgi:DNA-binding response OmpR family regulator
MTIQDRRALQVLVIDDEQDVRELLELAFAAEGHEVTTAADGAEALTLATSRQFHVATVDLRMPGLSGCEILAALRRLAPDMTIIVISGYVTDTEAAKLRSLGALTIMLKPFRIDSLLCTLRAAQRARSMQPES